MKEKKEKGRWKGLPFGKGGKREDSMTSSELNVESQGLNEVYKNMATSAFSEEMTLLHEEEPMEGETTILSMEPPMVEEEPMEGETTILSMEPPMVEEEPMEGETTILSVEPPMVEEGPMEGETTILSVEPPMVEEEPMEGETTILSMEPPMMEKEPVEGETTILSMEPPMMKEEPMEGETTILSMEPPMMEEEPAEGETTVLSMEPMSFVGENTNNYITELMLGNELSESETTLFSAPGESVEMEDLPGLSNGTMTIVETRTGRRTVVKKNVFLVGKDKANMDLVIDDRSVSRHHATIMCESDSYYIMDNKSTNGTSMEGISLAAYEKAELYDGSIVSFGNVSVQIEIR